MLASWASSVADAEAGGAVGGGCDGEDEDDDDDDGYEACCGEGALDEELAAERV